MQPTQTSGRGRGELVGVLCLIVGLSAALWALLSVWTSAPFAGKSAYCTYTL